MSDPENEGGTEEERKRRLNKTLAIVAVVMFGLSFFWHVVSVFFIKNP